MYSYNRISRVILPWYVLELCTVFLFSSQFAPWANATYSTDNFNLAIGKQIGLDMNMKILRDNSETHSKGEDIENCPI